MSRILHKKMNRASALYAILYDMLADLTSVSGGVVALDAEHDKVVTDLATLDAQVDAAVVDFASVDVAIDALIADLAALDAEVDAAVVDFTSADVAIDALIADLAALDAEVDAAVADFVSMDVAIDAGQVDTAAVRTQLIAAIDDDDNFRTAYDAANKLKTVYSLGTPEGEDDNQVVTSEAVPAQSATLTIAANPDVPRNITFTATIGGSLDALFTVVGVDQFGEAVTETFTVDAAPEVTGTKIFRIVTSITATTVTTDTGENTVIVGTGALLGLPVQITQAADVSQAFLNDALEGTPPTGDATYHAVTLASAPDGNAIEVVVSRDSVGATAKTASDPGAITAAAVAYTAAGGLTPTAVAVAYTAAGGLSPTAVAVAYTAAGGLTATGGAAALGSIGVTAPEPKSRDPMVDN